MRFASAISFGQIRRGPLILFGTLVVGAFAAYQVSQYVIAGDLAGMAYAGMTVVGGAIVLAILKNWRNGVYFFLGWLLFEDFARKFLGNNMAIYFAKDFLALVVFLSFVAAYRRKEVTSFRPPFLIPLLILVWFGAMQVFNPASTHIVFGLLGMKIYFYYIPLVFIGYALIDSEIELRRFFTIHLVLGLVIISLGSAQSILGPSFLNPAHPAEDIRLLSGLYRVSPITGAVAYRPTSVFVSAGRYADFILVIWLLVLGYLGYLLLRHKSGRNLAFVTVVVTACGGLLTASRGTFMWGMINALVTSAAFVWGAPWRQGEARRAFRGIQRGVLGVGLGIVLLLVTFPDALLSRLAIYQETLTPGSSTSELMHRGWDYPMQNFLGAFNYDRWPYGYGIGTTALGTQYVARIFNVKPVAAGVESGYGTIVVELGIGGLILWLIMSLAVSFSAWGVVKKLKGSPWFPLGFVIFWYAFILLVPFAFASMQAYEDYVLNAYLWLLLGILFRLPTLALSKQFAANTPIAQHQGRWMR